MSDASVWQNNQGRARRVIHEVHLPGTMQHESILYICIGQLDPDKVLKAEDESCSEFLSLNRLEVMRTKKRPGLALREIRLDLTRPTKMEIAGTEHEAIRRKTLGRSNKTLALGNLDTSSRKSPHLAKYEGHCGTNMDLGRGMPTVFMWHYVTDLNDLLQGYARCVYIICWFGVTKCTSGGRFYLFGV